MRNTIFVVGGLALSVSGFGCGGVSPSGEDGVVSTDAELRGSCELTKSTKFYVPPPDPGAVKQAEQLLRKRKISDALAIAALELVPSAVWFTSGTPAEVRRSVQKTARAAKLEKRVPILVPYNLPFRDCAQYSAGGALDTDAYKKWIDGFADGIGNTEALVILEPDGLGLIPYNQPLFGEVEKCKPTITDASGATVPAPGASSEERYAQIRYAVSSLKSRAPKASVYLDATHSAWLGVSEAAYRIYKAGFVDGVQQVQGFYVNVSNYQPTDQATQFGTWVSMCLAAGTPGVGPDWMQDPATGVPHFSWCPGQYDPATDFQKVNYTPEFAAGITAGIEGLMGGASAQAHFVIDTSRNGKGVLNSAPYAAEPYNQPPAVITALDTGNWCNPYGAGLGLRPTSNTGVPLVDAYLWVKTPGQSDGSCDIAGGARAWDYTKYNPWKLKGDAQNHFDPLWGIVDPAAGAWFPEQALQLVRNSTPKLR
ncbi:MAG: glycoside hydrolase family 6 protein [Pseudomonadota bacterium]